MSGTYLNEGKMVIATALIFNNSASGEIIFLRRRPTYEPNAGRLEFPGGHVEMSDIGVYTHPSFPDEEIALLHSLLREIGHFCLKYNCWSRSVRIFKPIGCLNISIFRF